MHPTRNHTGNIDSARYEISDTIYQAGCSPNRVSTHYTATKRQAERVAAAWRRDIRNLRNGYGKGNRVWISHDGNRADDGRYDHRVWGSVSIGPDRVVSITRVQVVTG